LGTGLTYWLSDNLQLNAGVNIGLTRAADDYNPFVGLAWRF
jgi:outer membrane putative beta-barrel porin/alpha-amylase